MGRRYYDSTGDEITLADVAPDPDPIPATIGCEDCEAINTGIACDGCEQAHIKAMADNCRRCGGSGCDRCNGTVGLFADVR